MDKEKVKRELDKKDKIIDALSSAVKNNKADVKKFKAENEKLRLELKRRDDLQNQMQNDIDELKIEVSKERAKTQRFTCNQAKAEKGSDSASQLDRSRELEFGSESLHSYDESKNNKADVKKFKAENEKLRLELKRRDDLQNQMQNEIDVLKIEVVKERAKTQRCTYNQAKAEKGSDSASQLDRSRELEFGSESLHSYDERSVVSVSKIDVGVCAPAPSEDKSKQEKHTNEKNPHFNEPTKQSNKQKEPDEKKAIRELNQKLQQEARVMQNLEKKLREMEASEKVLKNEIEIYKNDKISLENKLTKSEEKMDGMKNRFNADLIYRDNQIAKLNAELTSIASEKDNLLTSALAGAKLLDHNPNIADLSDPNRPTKLAEHYSELYDNEWTDAFTVLQDDGLDEMQCIGVLLNTLTTTYKMCEEKAEAQNTGLHSSMSEFLKGDGLPPEMNKHFKESRKKNYNKYIPELTQDMESKLSTLTNMPRKRVKLTTSSGSLLVDVYTGSSCLS